VSQPTSLAPSAENGSASTRPHQARAPARASAGQVECRCRSARIELAVTANGVRSRQGLDLDTFALELIERLRIGAHLPVRAGTHDQMLWKVLTDVLEVV
jgi:hypothetical protein